MAAKRVILGSAVALVVTLGLLAGGLFWLWQLTAICDSGSARLAQEWAERLEAFPDVEAARASDGQIWGQRFANGEWVFGLSQNSHGSPFTGGTVVVKDSPSTNSMASWRSGVSPSTRHRPSEDVTMAMEPITLFARIADPAAVARRLRELVPTVAIDGPNDTWHNAVVTFGKGKKKRSLTFTHDPDYHAEPKWSKQMSGMRGYFSRFPDTDNKQRVLMLTTSFRFSLGTLFDPDYDPEGDPRLEILSAVAELLDGVLFTPSALRDAHGRVLYGAGGAEAEDPDAVWPRVLGTVSIDSPLGTAMHEASRRKPPEQDVGAEPPTPERVARRALALTAVTARAILEQDTANPEAETTYQDLLAWVRDIGIDDEFEPDEREVVRRPLGRLDQRGQINSTWRLEGLVVLAWALGRFEIPPHDQLVALNPLWRSLGLLDAEAARALVAKPTLRSREEIRILRNRLFALHWRLRDYYANPRVMDFAAFARTCSFGPLDVEGLPLIEGDLGLRGERIDRAPREVFSSAHSTAQERHQAANWLWEGPPQYSRASVAT
jgi:hypothetical protein